MGNRQGCSGPPAEEGSSGPPAKEGSSSGPPAKEGSSPPASGRFADPWWRKFDEPTDGFKDSEGFVNRLPLRLESTEMIVFGTTDAEKMWAEFEDEDFLPILVGGKAVISIWFNNFTDSDCGGSYLETWYNTFVSRRSEGQIELQMESPMSVVINDPRCQNFLLRVVCGDAPDNPGAAMKAIVGGRSIFGFPRHPVLGQIQFRYGEADGKNTTWEFDASHNGWDAVKASIALPETDPTHIPMLLDVALVGDLVISAPKLGGTHKNHNGAHQGFFGQALAGTQFTTLWNKETDSIVLGNDDHYGSPISRWDFEPIVKGHIPDFKIAVSKPSGWISGAEAAAAVLEHEATLKAGTKLGAISTPWIKS